LAQQSFAEMQSPNVKVKRKRKTPRRGTSVGAKLKDRLLHNEYSHRHDIQQVRVSSDHADWAFFAATMLVSDFLDGDTKALPCLQIMSSFTVSALLDIADSGNERAVETVRELLNNLIHRFLAICAAKPELFRKTAGKTVLWPAFLSIDREYKQHLDNLVSQLGLGAATGLNWEGKLARSTGSQVARRLFWEIDAARENDALRLPAPGFYRDVPISLLRAQAKSLPVLSRKKEVQKQWWTVMSWLFEAVYGNDFERREEFQDYWKPYRTHAKYAHLKEYERRKLVRHQIRNVIKQGLGSIAAAT
jgi:hypothetical protein